MIFVWFWGDDSRCRWRIMMKEWWIFLGLDILLKREMVVLGFFISNLWIFSTLIFLKIFEKKYDTMMKLLKQISNVRLKMIFHAIIECDVRDWNLPDPTLILLRAAIYSFFLVFFLSFSLSPFKKRPYVSHMTTKWWTILRVKTEDKRSVNTDPQIWPVTVERIYLRGPIVRKLRHMAMRWFTMANTTWQKIPLYIIHRGFRAGYTRCILHSTL